MTDPNVLDSLNLFEAALKAFENRFESVLRSHWFHIFWRIHPFDLLKLGSASERHTQFNRAFDEAEIEISEVIHENFPVLLRVAIAQREHLGKTSPLDWTVHKVVSQVYSFLRMDEISGGTGQPKLDSMVLTTARGILSAWQSFYKVNPAEYVLPKFVGHRWRLAEVRYGESGDRSAEGFGDRMSRSETLEWVRDRELRLSTAVEGQITVEKLNAIIEGGSIGVSVLKPFVPTRDDYSPGPMPEVATGNVFRREGETWNIAFNGENCRLSRSLGLAYIAVLLRRPGCPIRALEVQELCVNPTTFIPLMTRTVNSLREEHQADAVEEESGFFILQSDFTDDPLMDEGYIQDAKAEMNRLEEQATLAGEIGDDKKCQELASEYDRLAQIVNSSRDVRGRSRQFTSENEKARISVTNAIQRAIKKISKNAPATARYLTDQIETGSEFMYRDSSVTWNL